MDGEMLPMLATDRDLLQNEVLVCERESLDVGDRSVKLNRREMCLRKCEFQRETQS